MLQGVYGGLERDQPLLRLPLRFLQMITVCFPLLGLFTCILTSILYHYNEATYTHCMVPNYLPSISAAINLTPERYIWRFCIGLHSGPRFMMAVVYFNFYRGRFARQLLNQIISVLTLLSALAENFGLLLLTYVCSSETYSYHKTGFITFIVSSLIHMMLTCKLWYTIKKQHQSAEEMTSYRYKVRLFLFSICCCLLGGYCFRRHNKYCEEGIYTWFAFFEYMVVLANMAFHMTSYWDFGNKELTITVPPESKYS